MKYKYRKLIKFKYKNINYQLFQDDFGKLAFLAIDETGNYRYPELNTLFELLAIFGNTANISNIKKRKLDYFKFTPKVKFAGAIIALSTAFLTGCAQNYYSPSNNYVNVEQDSNVEVNNTESADVEIDFSSIGSTNVYDENYDYRLEPYNGTGVPEQISQETLDFYLQYLSPADDSNDFMFATDYYTMDLINYQYAHDSSGYEQIFGYSDATLDEIHDVIYANSGIPSKYKDFIYDFISELEEKYPETNLAVFKHNLQTLIVDEVTQTELNMETVSTSAAACYIRTENRICVLDNLDLSRGSDDYIILTHELCHAGRSLDITNDDSGITKIAFYDTLYMGTYAEEAIITNLVTEMQGINDRAEFYPILTNYYRIICDCVGYEYTDFFNHSVNYLIHKMDTFMGDEQYAYQIVAMIDAQMTLRYSPHMEVDFHEFQPVYEYLAEMYFKKYITEDMNYTEAEEVFNTFYYEITYGMDTMNRKYTFNEDTFRPTFDSYLEEVGISKGLNR